MMTLWCEKGTFQKVGKDTPHGGKGAPHRAGKEHSQKGKGIVKAPIKKGWYRGRMGERISHAYTKIHNEAQFFSNDIC